MAILAGFVGYPLLHFSETESVGLLLLSALDVPVIGLDTPTKSVIFARPWCRDA